MRRAARIDETQAAIVHALRAHGASVQSLAVVGKGVPDLLVGWRGQNFLIECKSDRKVHRQRSELTDDQVQWMRDWHGSVHVVLTPQAALAFLAQSALHVEQPQVDLIPVEFAATDNYRLRA